MRIAQTLLMRAILPGLLISALLVLAGCGSSSSVVTTASGTSAYQVECGAPFGTGLFSTKLDCNRQAQEMCPSGFNPITSPPGRLVFTCSRRPVPATAPI